MPSKYAAQDKYNKENTVLVVMRLNKKLDSDILEAIGTENKQGTIKNLIRTALKRSNDSER